LYKKNSHFVTIKQTGGGGWTCGGRGRGNAGHGGRNNRGGGRNNSGGGVEKVEEVEEDRGGRVRGVVKEPKTQPRRQRKHIYYLISAR